MTALLVAAVILSACAGAGITHMVWRHWWQRWKDDHDYRRIDLEYRKVRKLWEDKDHFEREARRERHRAWLNRQLVGDLTMQLDRERHRPRRRSAVPTYGITRSPAWRWDALRGRDTA